MNSFSACPVSYRGTTVGELSFLSVLTNRNQAPIADGTPLSFRVSKDDDGKTIKAPPFTWHLKSENNADVENTADDEYWVGTTGDVKDDGGVLVTEQFGLGFLDHPLQFDFKAPTATAVHINKAAVAAGTSFSAGSAKSPVGLSVDGAADMGVGVDTKMTMIAVGDCAMNEADPKKVDRTKVGFKAIDGYGNVKLISALAEEDAVRNPDDDKSDVDCYVAELAQLKDRLGNAWMGNGTAKAPADWLQTANFGVDMTKPVMSEADPDNDMVFSAFPTLTFDVDNPDLASGDDSGDLTGTAKIGKESVGTVTFDGRDDREGTVKLDATAKALEKEGAKAVVVTVSDGATPANTASHTYKFAWDKTPATLTISRSQGSVDVPSADAVSVSVAGTLSDQSEIEKAALRLLLKSRDGEASTCAAATDTLPTKRLARHKRNLENGTNSIAFDETFTIKGPGGAAGSGPEDFCFVLSTEDVAVEADGKGDGNEKDFVASDFTVTWPAGPPVPTTPTFAFTTRTTAGDPSTGAAVTEALTVAEGQFVDYWVSLKDVETAPTDEAPLTVTITPQPGITVTPATLTFNATNNDSLQVTATAVHDRDMVTETITVNHTAEGYTAAAIMVKSADDDFSISVNKSSIEEDDPAATVEVTVTAATATDASRDVDVTFAEADGADSGEFTATDVTVTIAAGKTSGKAETSVDALADIAQDEAGESIEVRVAASNPAGVYYAPAKIAIVDNDPDFTLSLSQTEVGEGDGTVTITLTATGTTGVNEQTTFVLALVGTATFGQGNDYEGPASVNMELDVGETTATATVTLTINDDADAEGNETIVFQDTDGAGINPILSIQPATLTIKDNDGS